MITDTAEEMIKGGWLTQDQIMLLRQAIYLMEREAQHQTVKEIVDYGFLVFTAAKVYEGFLKYFFYQLGLISRQQFYDEHLRIGKALNPDLPKTFRNNTWLYDDLVEVCGRELAERLWETWKRGRNQIFHYFPDDGLLLGQSQARSIIETIVEAMAMACRCQVRKKDIS